MQNGVKVLNMNYREQFFNETIAMLPMGSFMFSDIGNENIGFGKFLCIRRRGHLRNRRKICNFICSPGLLCAIITVSRTHFGHAGV